MDSRRVENELQDCLVVVETKIQADPKNVRFGEDLVITKNSLRRIQNHNIQGFKMRSKLNWLKCGDKC